jgi:predicted NAD/FAD-binding protein
LTAYFASAETIRGPAVLAATFAALLSHAQRVLSTPVRDLRRRTRRVTGVVERSDGTTVPLDAAALGRAPERALQILSAAVVMLALALLVLRVT